MNRTECLFTGVYRSGDYFLPFPLSTLLSSINRSVEYFREPRPLNAATGSFGRLKSFNQFVDEITAFTHGLFTERAEPFSDVIKFGLK